MAIRPYIAMAIRPYIAMAIRPYIATRKKEQGRRKKEEGRNNEPRHRGEHLKEAKKNCSGSVSLPRDLIGSETLHRTTNLQK
jgi:hypothetical protein